MAVNIVEPPFQTFKETDGEPLDSGYLYIGEPGLNAEAHPKQVYWDADLSIPATQPIRTIGGTPVYLGSPASIFVEGAYSIVVKDRREQLVNSSLFAPNLIESDVVFDTVAEMVASDQLEIGDIAETRGYFEAGDAGGNMYEIVEAATGTDDGGSYIDLDGLTAQAKGLFPAGYATGQQFGAVADNSTDCTVTLNAALASQDEVYLPSGVYYITDQLSIGSAKVFRGAGRNKTRIRIDTAFNGSATSVLDFTGAEPGPEILKMNFLCAQPTTPADRTEMNVYPPIIDASDMPRFRIDDVRIGGAYDGIKMDGNSGGFQIGFLELGAYNRGIFGADSHADFCHFDSLHIWPFGFAGGTGGAIENVYSDGSTVGIDLYKVDGLAANTIATFRASIRFGRAFGTISNLNLDGRYANFTLDDLADITVGACYCTTDRGEDFAIHVSGGSHMSVASFYALQHIAGTDPFILVEDAGSHLALNGAVWNSGSTSAPCIKATGGTIALIAPEFAFGGGTTRTAPFIEIDGARATILAARPEPIGAGSGELLTVSTDDWHHIDIGTTAGWDVTLPATLNNGHYNVRGYTNNVAMAYGYPLRFEDSGGVRKATMSVNGSDLVEYVGTVPGPYADDSAAASGGVAIGEMYRVTGGNIAWRQV